MSKSVSVNDESSDTSCEFSSIPSEKLNDVVPADNFISTKEPPANPGVGGRGKTRASTRKERARKRHATEPAIESNIANLNRHKQPSTSILQTATSVLNRTGSSSSHSSRSSASPPSNSTSGNNLNSSSSADDESEGISKNSTEMFDRTTNQQPQLQHDSENESLPLSATNQQNREVIDIPGDPVIATENLASDIYVVNEHTAEMQVNNYNIIRQQRQQKMSGCSPVSEADRSPIVSSIRDGRRQYYFSHALSPNENNRSHNSDIENQDNEQDLCQEDDDYDYKSQEEHEHFDQQVNESSFTSGDCGQSPCSVSNIIQAQAPCGADITDTLSNLRSESSKGSTSFEGSYSYSSDERHVYERSLHPDEEKQANTLDMYQQLELQGSPHIGAQYNSNEPYQVGVDALQQSSAQYTDQQHDVVKPADYPIEYYTDATGVTYEYNPQMSQNQVDSYGNHIPTVTRQEVKCSDQYGQHRPIVSPQNQEIYPSHAPRNLSGHAMVSPDCAQCRECWVNQCSNQCYVSAYNPQQDYSYLGLTQYMPYNPYTTQQGVPSNVTHHYNRDAQHQLPPTVKDGKTYNSANTSLTMQAQHHPANPTSGYAENHVPSSLVVEGQYYHQPGGSAIHQQLHEMSTPLDRHQQNTSLSHHSSSQSPDKPNVDMNPNTMIKKEGDEPGELSSLYQVFHSILDTSPLYAELVG